MIKHSDTILPYLRLQEFDRSTVAMIAGMFLTVTILPINLIFIAFLSCSIFLKFVSESTDVTQSFKVGFWFWLGHLTTSFYWIGIAPLQNPETYFLAPIGMFIAPLIIALVYASATVVIFLTGARGIVGIISTALIFTATDYIISDSLFHLPFRTITLIWNQYHTFMQIFSVLGIYGTEFLTWILVTTPTLLMISYKKNMVFALAALLVIVSVSTFGSVRLNKNPAEYFGSGNMVRMISTNILAYPQNEHTALSSLDEYIELSNLPPIKDINYVIWPEAGLNFILDCDHGDELLKFASRAANKILITGAITRCKSTYKNSIIAIDKSGKVIFEYNKKILVPFGEYIPLGSIISKLFPAINFSAFTGNFQEGGQQKEIAQASPLSGNMFSPTICYEILFPEAINVSKISKWILNVSNEGWFSNSIQHRIFEVSSQITAIELGMPIVRVVNGGPSIVTDSYGRITAKLKKGDKNKFLDANVPNISQRSTIYMAYINNNKFFKIAAIIFTITWIAISILLNIRVLSSNTKFKTNIFRRREALDENLNSK